MAVVNYSSLENGSSFSNRDSRNFGFFSLKNNGDKAVVRILYNDPSEFKVMSVHKERISGKFHTINCVREYNDPVNACPLCLAKGDVQTRFYIPMIQYEKDESGKVVPQFVVWERSLGYARVVKNLIDEYGPLKDMIFTITRDGEAGDLKTKYNILFANPKLYPDSEFILDPSICKDAESFSPLGTIVSNKSYEDIDEYVKTGEFPEKKSSGAKADVVADEEEFSYPLTGESTLPTIPEPPREVVEQSQPQRTVRQSATGSESQITRPRRYY